MTTEVRINPTSHDVLLTVQDYDSRTKSWGPTSTMLLEKGAVYTHHVHSDRRMFIEEVFDVESKRQQGVGVIFDADDAGEVAADAQRKADNEAQHEHLKAAAATKKGK